MVDEHVIMPLRSIEQRLTENEQKVKQCISAGQDCSSKVEEHEFRLGVTRTKLEVHDQKLVILDRSLRHKLRSSADADLLGDSPTWPTAAPLQQSGEELRVSPGAGLS